MLGQVLAHPDISLFKGCISFLNYVCVCVEACAHECRCLETREACWFPGAGVETVMSCPAWMPRVKLQASVRAELTLNCGAIPSPVKSLRVGWQVGIHRELPQHLPFQTATSVHILQGPHQSHDSLCNISPQSWVKLL